MEVINDILGYKNRKIYQDTDCFAFSLDSVMLANFATIRMRDENIVDLGCGNGVIPLIFSLRTSKKIIGVELQEKLFTLAKKSVSLNGLDSNISLIKQNIKDFAKNEKNVNHFNLVVCNPPYFKVNEKKNFFNVSKEKLIATHEVEINLNDLFICVKKILANDGNFALVHRPERLLEIFELYKKNGIEPKRVRFVYENVHRNSKLVLIEGQNNGKVGLKVEKPLVLYNEDGTYSEEYANLLVEVAK